MRDLLVQTEQTLALCVEQCQHIVATLPQPRSRSASTASTNDVDTAQLNVDNKKSEETQANDDNNDGVEKKSENLISL